MTSKLTITEGLAELKTITKRLLKKKEFVQGYVCRLERLVDPLLKQGGAPDLLSREMQAISDLETRIVAIRTAIQAVNLGTSLTVGAVTKTIAEWLTWRKEVSTERARFVSNLRMAIQQFRQQAANPGSVGGGRNAASSPAVEPTNVIVNLDETALAKEAEELESVLGDLDGQLSLKNATTLIEV